MAKSTAKILVVLIKILFLRFLLSFLMELRMVLHNDYHRTVQKTHKEYSCDHIHTKYKMSPSVSFLESYCQKCASTQDLKDNFETDERSICPCVSPYLGEKQKISNNFQHSIFPCILSNLDKI